MQNHIPSARSYERVNCTEKSREDHSLIRVTRCCSNEVRISLAIGDRSSFVCSS